MLGSQDLLIALAIGLIMFGSKKLPELARGLGQSVKEFKKGITNEGDADPAPTPPSAPPAAALASPAAPARHCGSCQAPLQGDWSHCPKCGAAATATG
jgi:sec-independent protein translocase protein TatA